MRASAAAKRGGLPRSAALAAGVTLAALVFLASTMQSLHRAPAGATGGTLTATGALATASGGGAGDGWQLDLRALAALGSEDAVRVQLPQ